MLGTYILIFLLSYSCIDVVHLNIDISTIYFTLVLCPLLPGQSLPVLYNLDSG